MSNSESLPRGILKVKAPQFDPYAHFDFFLAIWAVKLVIIGTFSLFL